VFSVKEDAQILWLANLATQQGILSRKGWSDWKIYLIIFSCLIVLPLTFFSPKSFMTIENRLT
jgi:hypothetical protein